MVGLSSAGGLIALLEEPENDLKKYALEKLNAMVDDFWAEISDSIQILEELSESADFPFHKLASLVTSKVYYHLGELEQSLKRALAAEEEFDVNVKTLYVTIIIEQSIDLYTRNQQAGTLSEDNLVSIVNRMFDRCLERGAVKQVLGIALETRRLDVLERCIATAKPAQQHALVEHTLTCAMTLISHHDFRNAVLVVLAKLLETLPGAADDSTLCQVAIILRNVDLVITVFKRILLAN